MREGTARFLNTIASGGNKVTLRLSTNPFRRADVLELVDHCEAPKGGAIYRLDTCRGKKIESLI